MAKEKASTSGLSLRDRIKAKSTIAETAVLTESTVYGKKEMIPTSVPMINVALGGRADGGFVPGLGIIAGPSKHFKSAYALLLTASFLKRHPDGVVLFYDSEFGTPESYFDGFGINKEQVIHSPITDIEQLKFDIVAQLDHLTRDDKVMILVDSVGNLASKKEVEDAKNKNSAADMSRAKAMKSLFRIVTPHLTLKDIPMVVVNHTYKTQEMYSKDVVSGGTGIYYSADWIWIVGRAQDTQGEGAKKELLGYTFTVKIEKSRYCKEGAKIPITVAFEGGIKQWSGLLAEAMAGNYVVKPANGWYSKVDPKTGEVCDKRYREADLEDNAEFWADMFTTTDFHQYLKEKYTLGGKIFCETEEVTDWSKLQMIEHQSSDGEEEEASAA